MQGKIIEYVEHGKFICAVVMEIAGKRFRLLNQNGREVNLPANRVVHQSTETLAVNAGRDSLINSLQDTAKARNELQLPVSLEDLWQLAIEENSHTFTPEFLTELSYGTDAVDDQIVSLIRAVFEDKIYFKYRDGKILAHSEETVEQLITRQEKEREKQLLLDAGAKGLKEFQQGKEPKGWPREQCLRLIKDYYLFDKEADDWELAKELLKRAGLTAPHDPLHLLIKSGEWQEHENIGLLRYQVPTDFSQEVTDQVESIISNVDLNDLNGRIDLRDLNIITIDGALTRDFDDALHVEKKGENFEVGIHISDVASHIPPNSPLFKEAEERTTSLYFPDATIPMLPRELSEGALSLLKNKDRAALSFLVTLSPAGEVIQSRIVRSLICVKQQLSYNEAESQAVNDSTLHSLALLSQKLLQRRIENGALIIPIPDVIFHFDQGIVSDISLNNVDSPMRVLVSEFMVLANELAAAFLANKSEPGLYRTQEPARKRFFKQPERDLYVNFRQRRFLSRGHLLTTPKRHDGVGTEQYTTATSPIRRLLDLVIQHQITNILAGKGACFTEKDMQGFASIITSAQSRLNQVRQLRHRYWMFTFLATIKGERFPAIVIDKRNRKLQVVLRDYLLEGELPPNQAVKPDLGDTVTVRIGQINALDNTIRLEW